MSIHEPRATKGTNQYIFNYFYGFNAEDLSDVGSQDYRVSQQFSDYSNEKKNDKLSQEKKPQKLLSSCMAYIFLLKGFIAAGILTLTIGFRQSGDLWATIFLVIAGILTAIGCIKLIQSRVVVPLSYSGIAMVTYGRWLKITTDVVIVVSQTGFVTAYISFISIHVNAVACWAVNKVGSNQIVVSKWYVAIGTFLVWTFLCWVRKIHVFAHFHLLADICISIGVIVIIIEACMQIEIGSLGTPNYIYSGNLFDLLAFMGNSVYVYEGVGVLIPIYESMRNKSDFKFILLLLMLTLAILYIFVGMSTEIAFADKIKPTHSFVTQTINQNYPKRWINYIIQILWMINLIPTYPLVLFPAFRIMEDGLFSGYKGPVWKRRWMKNLFRTFWVALTIFIATIFQSVISKILGITGAIACAPVAFTLPAMFHLKLRARRKCDKACDWTLIIGSLIILLFSTTFNIIDMVRSFQ